MLPQQLQIGRISRLFSKWSSSKGPSGPLTIGSEIVAVLPLFRGAEDRYLEGWQRYISTFNQAALAANPSSVHFRNPKGSNVIAVIERFAIAQSVADPVPPANLINLGVTVDQATVLGAARAIDFRQTSQKSTIVISRGNAAIPAGGITGFPALAVNGIADLVIADVQEFGAIAPGDGFAYQSIANTALTGMFIWRERLLEESETT